MKTYVMSILLSDKCRAALEVVDSADDRLRIHVFVSSIEV